MQYTPVQNTQNQANVICMNEWKIAFLPFVNHVIVYIYADFCVLVKSSFPEGV